MYSLSYNMDRQITRNEWIYFILDTATIEITIHKVRTILQADTITKKNSNEKELKQLMSNVRINAVEFDESMSIFGDS